MWANGERESNDLAFGVVLPKCFDTFLPVVRMARRAEISPEATDAELYMWLACERYRLVRRHVWDESIIDELRTAAPRRRP